ncbi:MAG: hypothetical protein CMJ67_07430 [Planctomycetaceae bacterium]|nr:hypothetical protein [Planctomycetaceae bacterium]
MSKPCKDGWVSVVIPSYNRASRLVASVNSCLEQTYEKVEVIVVDDGSTDETRQVLEGLVERWGAERVRSIHQENQGAPAARNAGMAVATGEYLQWHDSDDLLMPDKLAEQVAAIERTGADCAVCDVLDVRDDAEHTPLAENRYDHDLIAATGRYRHASIPALLMRRSTYPEMLRWNTRLKRYQDVDFVVRYLLSIRSVVYTPGFHVLYIHHEESRITDSYPEGPQERAMFDGLVEYWGQARDVVPVRSHALFRNAALTLAWMAALRGQAADARAMIPFAVKGPGAMARWPRVAATAVMSCVPAAVLAQMRRFKRWFESRV